MVSVNGNKRKTDPLRSDLKGPERCFEYALGLPALCYGVPHKDRGDFGAGGFALGD